MPVQLPTFADLPTINPRAAGGLPSYPESDPGAVGEATLGKGVSAAGEAIGDFVAENQRKKDRLEQALATTDLFNRLTPLHEEISKETDPAKLAELRGQYKTLLDTSGGGISNPYARQMWVASHGKTIAQANADADRRNTDLDRNAAVASVRSQIDRAVRTAADADDPQAFENGRLAISNIIEYGKQYGALLPTQAYELGKGAQVDMTAGRLDNLIARGRLDEASTLLNQNRGDLGADRAAHFEQRITTKNEKAGVQADINSEWGGADKGYAGNRGAAADLSGVGVGHAAPKAERVAFARDYAKSKGINPDAVVATMAGEGLNIYTGDGGTSFGDFQLHVGGGMGDEAVAAGINIRDPKTWKEQTQFAIDQMAANRDRGAEWYAGQWHGAPAWAARAFAQAGGARGDAAPQEAAVKPRAFDFAAGDSIAVGSIRHGGVGGNAITLVSNPGSADADAAGGRNPQQGLDYIVAHPERFQGKTVLWSSGLMNAGTSGASQALPVVEQQLDALKAAGANVVLVGVDQGKFDQYNAALSAIAEAKGVQFAGPLPTKDVHPSRQGYASYAANAAKMIGGADFVGGADQQPAGRIDETASRDLGAEISAAPAGGQQPGVVASASPAQSALPDIDAMTARVQARADSGQITQDRANAVMAGLRSRYNHVQAAQATDRAALTKRLSNGAAALGDGHDFDYDPGQVRHFFPKEKADEIIQTLDDAKAAGQVMAGVRTASPEDLGRQEQQLAAGLQDPQATDYSRRRKQAVAFDAAVKRRADALGKDPAGYVAQYSPSVVAKYAAIDPGNPATFSDYATTALAEQARLGVPEESRSVLPAGQASAVASKLASLDPAKVNIGSAISDTAKSYGEYWPQVFGDLVRAKLPGVYQVVASMDRPDQAVAASDLSRAIGLAAEKGGMSAMKKSLGEEKIKDIDKEVTSNLENFRDSVGLQSGGQKLYGTVFDAAHDLAGYYVFRGENPNNAAAHAVDSIITAKYDFGSIGAKQVRVPKGTMGIVDTAARRVQDSITTNEGDTFGPVPGNPLLKPEQRKSIWMDAIRNGGWANNGDDSGLVLMGRFKDNSYGVVRRADGSQIVLKFADAPAIAATAPSPVSPYIPENTGLTPGEEGRSVSDVIGEMAPDLPDIGLLPSRNAKPPERQPSQPVNRPLLGPVLPSRSP